MAERTSTLTVAAALAGAVAIAGIAAPASDALAQGAKVKCYGVAMKGQNDCANAAGTHSCAGQSKVDFDGGDWKYAKAAAECTSMGGQTAAFKGKNPKKS